MGLDAAGEADAALLSRGRGEWMDSCSHGEEWGELMACPLVAKDVGLLPEWTF